MARGTQTVARARGLIGARFVPQGRDPKNGLDCVGLTIAAFRLDASEVPDDYRLSGEHRAAILDAAMPQFRRVSRRRLSAGDLLLLRAGARHWHLGIWTGEGMVHADARRGMVVERPGQPEWPLVAAFRRRVRPKKGY